MLDYNKSLETGQIYNVDSFNFGKNLLKDVKFLGFDLILVNPPLYSEKQTQWNTAFDYNFWLEERLDVYTKLLNSRGNLVIYTNERCNFFIRSILRKSLIEKKSIIWVKKSDTVSINPNLKQSAIRTLINGYEQILWYAKSSSYIFNQQYSKTNFNNYNNDNNIENTDMLTDVWTDIKTIDSDRYVKPERLSDRIVRLFSYSGVVYIPFAGSGNEIVSCMKNRKKWIATETSMPIINNVINPKIKDRKNIIQKLINYD